jgi:hypothetical protein
MDVSFWIAEYYGLPQITTPSTRSDDEAVGYTSSTYMNIARV